MDVDSGDNFSAETLQKRVIELYQQKPTRFSTMEIAENQLKFEVINTLLTTRKVNKIPWKTK